MGGGTGGNEIKVGGLVGCLGSGTLGKERCYRYEVGLWVIGWVPNQWPPYLSAPDRTTAGAKPIPPLSHSRTPLSN